MLMRSQRFTIPNRLASYGELITTANHNTKAIRDSERHNLHLVGWAIAKADLAPIRRSCVIYVKWVEPSSARKPANVAAGAIFIEQALIAAGVINDAVQIEGIYSTFATNARNPSVEVEIRSRF